MKRFQVTDLHLAALLATQCSASPKAPRFSMNILLGHSKAFSALTSYQANETAACFTLRVNIFQPVSPRVLR